MAWYGTERLGNAYGIWHSVQEHGMVRDMAVLQELGN